MNELEFDNCKINWVESLSKPEFWDKLSQSGVWPQQQFNVSDEMLSKYYSAAAEYLEEKSWSEAQDCFLFLTFLNPNYQNFWLGLAIAQQALGEFDAALVAYVMAESLDPDNPVIHANSFQCHLAAGNQDLAEQSYQRALEICGDKPEFLEIKSKLMQQKSRIN